jgi:hypothetical protein
MFGANQIRSVKQFWHNAGTVGAGLEVVLAGRGVILLGLIGGFAAAIYLLINTTPLYTARMVVGPAQIDSSGGNGALGGLRAQISTLVGGSNGGSGSVDPYQLFNELLTSASLADRLQQRHQVLQVLNEGRWDKVNQRWLPPGFLSRTYGLVKEAFGRPAWVPPNVNDLHALLESGVTSSSDNGSQFFRVYTYKNADPRKAEWLLGLLYAEADLEARQLSLNRANTLTAYIQAKLATTTETNYQAALGQALAQQELLRMMSQSNAPFAAQLLDAPRASAAPTDPPILTTIIFYTVIGGVLGLIAAYVLAWRAATRQATDDLEH